MKKKMRYIAKLIPFGIRSEITTLVRKILLSGLGLIPTQDLELLLLDVAKRRIKKLSPAAALQFLFRLDAALYGLQKHSAVVYGGGIHTKHRHMRYHVFFTGRVNKNDRVLDIGCGIGAVAYDVSKDAAEVVGMDFNADSIKTARERYQNPNLVFRVGDALETLPNEEFSVVILSNVLEHLPDRKQFLRRVQETLHPRCILIRVPLFERDWRVPLKKELGVEWRLDTTHETEYTLEAFAEEMHAANLHIDHLEVRWGEIWSEVSHQP